MRTNFKNILKKGSMLNNKIKHTGFGLVLCCLLAMSSCLSDKKESKKINIEEYYGAWQGTAHQYDTNSDWDMELKADNQNFTITYPISQCGGYWKLEAINTNHIVLRETITYGIENCVTKGKVVLEKKGNKLLYKYFYPTDAILNSKGELFKMDEWRL